MAGEWEEVETWAPKCGWRRNRLQVYARFGSEQAREHPATSGL